MMFLLAYSVSVACVSVGASGVLWPRPFTLKRALVEFPIAAVIAAAALIAELWS
jgi:hypothetical protein